MSERSERLFEALSEIDEQKIDEASPSDRTNRATWKRWGVLAAALVLVVGVGSYVLPRLGGSAGNGGAGGAGADGATTFMSYAGPVFPLTLKEADSAITAEREITLDFAPWVPVWVPNEEEAGSREGVTPEVRQEVLDDYNEWYPEGGQWKSSTDIQVTDAYTLTNATSEDKTVSVLYPFAGMLLYLEKIRPILTAGGQELETVLHAGQYSGGFQGAWEGWPNRTDNPGTVNLDQPRSWEDYRDSLEGGDYLQSALGEWADLSGVPVTVYEFTNPWGPEPDEKAGIPNPSIRVEFDLAYDKTEVLSYGFGGGLYDQENGHQGKSFSIPRDFWPEYDKYPKYLIVLGEDIQNMTTQGYGTGGWDKDDPTIEAGVTVQRYESNLEDILYTVAQYALKEEKDFNLAYGLWKDWLLSYGVLSDDPMERYQWGDIEPMDVNIMSRVFYLEAEVTIPAGGSVTLTAEMTKEGSYDFYCAHTKNRGVYGYDMVTRLGSNLNCTGQTAVLEDRGQIEIIRQNFGFDLESGVRRVTLDQAQEHYYLEVKGREGRMEQ